ncbi:5-formyltetrahydrofolate cyclo-ligase [Neisseria chenwenguii]|uniref:5-formyltetrahydrofolate cyclo-ligase n=1 Tax=Neisseria chenwenguii TaxID=1853278 RepID=A0A220S294_9NEIS|nr:5-formyltetrahydrofolate cyclo-ligase [Neisseria chenwenguii]ASK27496.1 5-formyltetrahydrofolate cyclo-ligase [Neisseria chenwenguii]ROV55576.1 5-formyltetrahydrofolate cyclo-ligase [Neisseria chenwenguii]
MKNQEKTELRRQLRRACSAMSREERAAATLAANRLLKRFAKRGARIGAYWPMGKELELNLFFQTALKRGARLFLPYIEPREKRLWFTPYHSDGAAPERKRGRSKLYIPQFAGRKIRAHDLDLLLVPVVGIDAQGYRLGQAGGFYDVSLAALRHRLPLKTLGVGFDCQMVGVLPREAHDIPLGGFVSEKGIFYFKNEFFRRPQPT